MAPDTGKYNNNDPLYTIDSFNPLPAVPFHRKPVFWASASILIILTAVSIFIVNLLEEDPDINLIQRIAYAREEIRIYFYPETCLTEPEYSVTAVSDSGFCLEIYGVTRGYSYTSNYQYGLLRNIHREFSSDTMRFTFEFDTLTAEPEISFNLNPPELVINYHSGIGEKFIVVLDPGHGGDRPGAIGRGGTQEKHLVLETGQIIKSLLSENEEIMVIMTRNRDRGVSIAERIRLSRFWRPDLFISLHANSARNRTVNQTEIYYASQRGRETARLLQSRLNREVSFRPVKTRRRGFAVIRSSNAFYGAVLIEMLYLSNTNGERMLNDSNTLQRFAELISETIIDIKNR